MKIKILTFLLFFIFGATSSFAVIDVKKNEHHEVSPISSKDNFQKGKKGIRSWFGKKKFKKRKFRLRDLFVIKNKIKKAKKVKSEEKTKIHINALVSAIVTTLLLIGIRLLSYLTGNGWILLVIVSMSILGILYGVDAIKAIKENPDKFRGKALATYGVVISGIVLALTLLLLLFISYLKG